MCTSEKIFQYYKRHAREALDISATNKQAVQEKRKEEFDIMRFKVLLENKGI